MKGFISVDIPTKKYIKAYIVNQLGDRPILDSTNLFGNKLYDCLAHTTNERRLQFANSRYNASLRIYITVHVFNHRGAYLNETNIKNFNQFVESHLKEKFYFMMDFYCSILPSFEAHLQTVRNELGIDIEDWSDDSMKKDYYRYRKRTGRKLFFDKKSPLTVPSEKAENLAF